MPQMISSFELKLPSKEALFVSYVKMPSGAKLVSMHQPMMRPIDAITLWARHGFNSAEAPKVNRKFLTIPAGWEFELPINAVLVGSCSALFPDEAVGMSHVFVFDLGEVV